MSRAGSAAGDAGGISRLIWRLYAPAGLRGRLLAYGRTYLCPFERILSYAPSRGRFIEIGCGTGVFANLLATAGGERDVVGYDADPAAIAVAQATVGGRSKMKFAVARVEGLGPLEPADAIAAIDLFHHLDAATQLQTIDWVNRTLKPGGVFLLKEIDRHPAWMYFANKLHDAIMDPGNPLCVRPHEEYLRVLQAAGFEATCESMHKLVYPHVLFVARKR